LFPSFLVLLVRLQCRLSCLAPEAAAPASFVSLPGVMSRI
jgi:hypothetical protein